jgi:hypothetical protein
MGTSAHAIYDAGYGALDHTVFFGETALGLSGSGLCSDGGDIGICQFAIAERHDAGVHGMVMVIDSADPFEVSDGVIRLDSIDVVDLGKVIRVRDECLCNEAMNRDVPKERCVSQVDGWVTTRVGFSPQLPSFEISRPCNALSIPDHGLPNSWQATNASDVADLVQMSEFGDVNRAPFFSNHASLSLELLASFSMAYVANQDGDVTCRLL